MLLYRMLTDNGMTDEAQQSHQEVYGAPEEHRGKFSHEVLAGGAAFEGMKLYEDHQRKEGGLAT